MLLLPWPLDVTSWSHFSGTNSVYIYKEAEAGSGEGESSCICRVSKIEICGADVWPGHSRWLFSCSLHIRCPTSAYFTCIPVIWLTFLGAYPRPQVLIVLLKGAVRDTHLSLVREMRPPDVNSPITNDLPFALEAKTAAMSSPLSAACSGVLLQHLASDM